MICLTECGQLSAVDEKWSGGCNSDRAMSPKRNGDDLKLIENGTN